jgi:hypothetical protein
VRTELHCPCSLLHPNGHRASRPNRSRAWPSREAGSRDQPCRILAVARGSAARATAFGNDSGARERRFPLAMRSNHNFADVLAWTTPHRFGLPARPVAALSPHLPRSGSLLGAAECEGGIARRLSTGVILGHSDRRRHRAGRPSVVCEIARSERSPPRCDQRDAIPLPTLCRLADAVLSSRSLAMCLMTAVRVRSR